MLTTSTDGCCLYYKLINEFRLKWAKGNMKLVSGISAQSGHETIVDNIMKMKTFPLP